MSENDKVISVNNLNALKFSGADLIGIEAADATRKLGAINIADAHNITFRIVAGALGHAGRQKALAFVAQGVTRAVIDPKRSLGVVKKGDAPLVALEAA